MTSGPDGRVLRASIGVMPLLAVLSAAALLLPPAGHAADLSVQIPQGVKVSSAPEEARGPFREGTELVKGPETDPSRLDTEEKSGSRRSRATGGGAAAPAKAVAFSLGGESVFFAGSQRSPAATTSWKDGASLNHNSALLDPQIAVSRSAVAVLTWDQLVFYDKSGAPLPSTAKFPNPTNLRTLFAKLLPDVEKHLRLNAAVTNIPDFQLDKGQVGDARIVFDVLRKRWVVVGTAKNNGADPRLWPGVLIRSQRRTKILFAISRDEDPAQGFNTYFFNGTPDDGACDATSDSSTCPGSPFTPGNAGDYPSVGVSAMHYLVTLHVDHAPVDGSDSHPLWGYLVTVNADDVAQGAPKPRTHAFWGWELAGGGNAEGVTMPVVKHNKLAPIDWGLIVSTHDDKLIITGVAPSEPPSLISVAFSVPGMERPTQWGQKGSFRQVDDSNVGNQPITAHLVGDKLFTAFNDCRKWVGSQSDCSPSIHLFSADVKLFPTTLPGIDRIFGWRSVLDDASDDVVAYGMPGIAANADGDLAVVYSRSSPKMFPQVRYSTWMHDEVDLRPSRLLRAGDGPIPATLTDCLPPGRCSGLRTDTAGVAVDPFDHTAIWMAHLFADASGGWSVAVGKVFGKQNPDLTISGVSFAPAALHAGQPLQVSYTAGNGGDGPAQKPRARVVLVAESGNARIPLGEEDAPADLAAGAAAVRTLTVHLPAKLAAGKYRVRVKGRLAGGEKEYSDDNNEAGDQDHLLKVEI